MFCICCEILWILRHFRFVYVARFDVMSASGLQAIRIMKIIIIKFIYIAQVMHA